MYENMSLGEMYKERQELIAESLCLQKYISKLKDQVRELETEPEEKDEKPEPPPSKMVPEWRG